MTPKSFYYPSPSGAPPAWQPSDLPNLVAYYTAQDASSIDLNVNDVLQWRPQYGETNWDLNPVGTITYNATGLNGLPSVESTANSAYLQTTNILNITDISIALVINFNNDDRQGFLAGNNKMGLRVHDFNTAIFCISGSGTGLGTNPFLAYTGATNVLMLPMFCYDDANQLLTGNLDGTDIGVDTSRTDLTGTQGTLKVFASPLSPGNPDVLWGTQIGAVIVSSNQFTLDEREKVQGFFAHDWNLTALLPAGHPYKDDPP